MKQRNDRNRMIKKAREMIKNPAGYTKATSYGAAGYISNIEFDRTTGEIKTEKELFLDEDYEIRKIYRGLTKIEDTFKVSKTNFEARPTFVWTKEHIEGHFLTCFTALVMIRLLEKRLNYKYSVDRIIETAKKYNCINIDRNIYQFIYNDSIIKDISEEFDIDLNKKYRKRDEIKKLLKY